MRADGSNVRRARIAAVTLGAVSFVACGPTTMGTDAGLDAIDAVDIVLEASTDTAATDVGIDATPRTPLRVGEPGGCNGLRSSCTRSYDRVAIAATHNAFSYATGGPVHYSFPNQDLPIPDQLNAGIRGLGLRPCPYFGSDHSQLDRVYVTHNSSLRGILGEEPLDGILLRIKSFLDANPNEVVTLYMESSVTPARVGAVFDQVGLTPYLFVLDRTRGWPTLREMITAGTRLVAFNDSQDAARPTWMLYLWDQIVDTDYNVTNPSQFSCAFYRGQPANPIYYLNEFVYDDLGNGILVPNETNARTANAMPFIIDRARRCFRETGRTASVIYVDWYGQGNVVDAVDALNRAYAINDGGL